MILKKFLSSLKGIEIYIAISLIGGVIIYVFNIIGVEIYKLNPSIPYAIAMALNYVVSYLGHSYYFNQSADKQSLFKFILSILVFFVFTNFIFFILVNKLHIHYLVSITINMIIFPLMKFLSYKYLVFRQNEPGNF